MKQKRLTQSELDALLNDTAAVQTEALRLDALLPAVYEAAQRLPAAFIRFNKSAIGSLQQLERFTSSVTGAVDAVFRGGHREYVSRRCFADIRRRLEK